MSYAFSQHGVGSAGGFSASEPASSLYGDLAFGGSLVPGTKRSLEDVLYDTWWMPRVLAWVAPYQSEILMMLIKSVFKNYVPHLRIGQTEALFSSNSLIKHLRLETGSNLPIYPQRPGAKDCAHYMTTRTCKFGDACKFDHPIWVPEGGVPGWKEIPLIPSNESFPERPGEPDCPYYMKTQSCKFGVSCKFNHPKHVSTRELGEGVAEASDTSILPERPSEPVCSFYMKTGKCKFGANCKFHHPKDLAPSNEEDSGKITQQDAAAASTCISFTPALLHNSKGLPIRLGEVDCPFYLKTGSCKYGSNCCYNHPDRNTINPPLVAGIGQNILPSAVANYSIGVLNPVPTFLQNIDLQSAQGSLGVIPALYPQRPGEIDCDFYMKTGYCKFGERCKFHHPIDRSAQILDAKQALQQTVKYTLADLPRREGVASCSFFMKTGTCKFGPACKFNHPTGDDGKGGGT